MTSSGQLISSSRPRAAKMPTTARKRPLTRPSVTDVWTVVWTPSSSFAPKQRAATTFAPSDRPTNRLTSRLMSAPLEPTAASAVLPAKRIEQQLQDAGCRQRQGKQDDLLQHGAAGQIAGPGILCHGNTLPPRRSEDHSRKNAPSNSGRRRYIYIIIQACVKYKQKTGKFESFPYKKAPPQMQGCHCETEAYFWVFM